MTWLTPDERLPQEGEKVLACDIKARNPTVLLTWFTWKPYGMEGGGFDCHGFAVTDEDMNCGHVRTVTHWAPVLDLPADDPRRS